MNPEKVAQYKNFLKRKGNLASDNTFESKLYIGLYQTKQKVFNVAYQVRVLQKNSYHTPYLEYGKNDRPITANQLSGKCYLIKGPYYGPQFMIYVGSIWAEKLQVFYVPNENTKLCQAWKMDFIDLQRMRPLNKIDLIDISHAENYHKYLKEYDAVPKVTTLDLPIIIKCKDGDIELPRKTFAKNSIYLQKIMTNDNFSKPDLLSFPDFTTETVLNYYYGKPYVVGSTELGNLDLFLETLSFSVYVQDYASVDFWHWTINKTLYKNYDANNETKVMKYYKDLELLNF